MVAAPSRGSIPPAAAAADPVACVTPGATPTSSFADAVAAKTARAAALAATAAFAHWLTDFRRADASAQSGLAATGLPLATTRRAALKYLIETDPERALALAVPVGLRAELPADIQARLERRVDSRGGLEVSISHLGQAARIERVAVIDGTSYAAFVFGRREAQHTKTGLPLHGIAVDDALALDPAPLRVLDDTEKLAHGLALDTTAAWVGGKLTLLPSPADLAQLEAKLLAAESPPGPHLPELASGSPTEPTLPATAALTKEPSWINGTKRVLWLKIDFSDEAGAPFTDAEVQTGADGLGAYFTANSQGKTTLVSSIVPTTLRMPKLKSYYEASGSTTNELYVAAHDAAQAYDRANGNTGAWDPAKFDRYIIVHKRVATYLFGGVAQLGGPRVGLNNNASGGLAGHEIGHTQSLAHSHYWLPSGNTPTGAGAHIEYGDVFDIMGAANITNHLNVAQKAKLGYLESAAISTVSTTGTVRLFRHDDPAATGVRALRVAPSDLGYEMWVEHRRTAPANFTAAQTDRVRNGVFVHWGADRKAPGFTTGQGTYLLDATPGSAAGANDAPFRIGETFIDPDAGVTIKPLAVGGTAPAEYIDVQVSFGATDGNRDPVLAANLPAAALRARDNIVFNASGTDPDGDAVYFRWDFGDGSLQPNLPSVTRRFPKGGAYSLRVSSHDGKGGIAVKNLALNVSDPLIAWTPRTSAVTNTLSTALYAAGKFVVAGDNGAIVTSADGTTWTRSTTPSNAHFYRGLAHNGSRFVAVGQGANNALPRATGAYSTDGTAWTAATFPSGVGSLFATAYGVGRFVAVGETGRIYHSTDGATWTEGSSPITSTLRAITYADDLFVAVGDGGRIVTSLDGVTWANRSTTTANSFAAVARHNGVWHASSSTAEVFTSPDGALWTRLGAAGRTNNTQRMISSGGVLLTTTTAGSIAFTEDPRAWMQQQLDPTASSTLYALAEGNGVLVAAGSRGTLFTTMVAPATPALAAPRLRLEADSLKVAVGRKNVLSAQGTGFVKLELYANGTKVSEIAASAGALTWTPPVLGNYVLTVRGVDASGAGAVSASYAAVAAFDGWRWRNPSPVGTDLRGAVRADNKWWMVGGGGTLLTLDDSGNLLPVDFSTTQQLNGIAYANGRFVITTTDLDGATKEDIGGLWTSTDGYAWTPFLTGSTDSANLNTALYAANRWIALGSGGVIVTSTDGTNWPRAASGITQSLYGSAARAGMIVAVGAGGKIITSPDGLAWTERPSGVTSDLRAVAFAQGTWIAAGLGGVILTSPDGTTWTRATSGITTALYAAAYVRGAFTVAGDNGVTLTSPTGTTWTAASLGGNLSGAFALAASEEGAVLVGRNGEIYQPTGGTAWRRLTAGTTEARQAVIYAGGKFVSVGHHTDPITRAPLNPVQVSTDGITWTRATGSLNPLTAVVYGQSRYVALGANSAIYTSADALAWTAGQANATAGFTCLASGPGLFVAAGSGAAIYSSPNGTTWTQRASSLGAAQNGAAYGAGRFVVVGSSGQIRHSVDGTTWITATSGVTTSLLAIGYWDDVGFIAVGNAGTILNSPDGATWQARESGLAENLTAIARTPVGYVAAGGSQGTALVSLDGVSWAITAIPADKTIRGIAASASTIVAVGDGGTTLAFELADTTPAPVIVAQPLSRAGVAGDTVRFTVSAQNAAGAVYQWQRNGMPILGANGPVFTLPATTTADAGAYTVTVTSPTGVTTSAPANLSFGAVTDPGRLINLSILTALTDATDSFSFGVVVGGAGTLGGKPLLVRAVGPSLGALGVGGTLEDPKLEFFTGAAKVGENDNWGGVASTSAVMASVGAFAFTAPNSRDAAISLPSLASGANSAKISGTGAGTVIAELYDATPAGQFLATTPRLINVSVLKGLGDGVTAGFVIGGSTARTVLIRAIGPTLAGFGVGGTVADPRLSLFSGQTQIGTNDNWGGGTTLAAAFAQVGAFGLAADSRDAALLQNLPPGAYTVQVSGADGTSGVALVEVYEMPE